MLKWKIHLIAMMAAAAIGAVVASLGLSSLEPALIGVVAFLLAAPVAYSISEDTFDLFEPIIIVNVVFAYLFVLRPAADLVGGSPYNVEGTFTPALLLALAGIVAFEFGYLLPLGNKLSSALPIPLAPIGRGRLIGLAAVLTFVAFGLFVAFIVASGGTSALALLAAGRSSAASSVYASSTGYLYSGPGLAIPACLVLLALALIDKRHRLLFLGLSTVPAALVCATALLQGNRSGLVGLALPVLALPYVVRHRRPRWLATLFFAYLFLTVGSYVVQHRNATTDQSVQLASTSIFNPVDSAQYWIKGADGSEFDILAVELQSVPSQIPFTPGATLMDFGTRAVPRVVWPDKPLERSDVLTVTLFPAEYYATRNDFLPTMVGILYMDSGLLTVLIGMAVLGVMLKTLWRYFQAHSRSLFAQLLYVAWMPAIFLLMRGSPVQVFSGLLFTVGPLVLMFWFPGARAVVSARGVSAYPVATKDHGS